MAKRGGTEGQRKGGREGKFSLFVVVVVVVVVLFCFFNL